MTDEEMMELLKSIDPSAVRIPPGVRKIIEYFEIERFYREDELKEWRRVAEYAGCHTPMCLEKVLVELSK